MRGITSRFVFLIATAAVAPLVIYGWVSIRSLRTGTSQTVASGNQAVATQVAGRINLYFANNLRVLDSIGTQLRGTQLQQWQKERILKNNVLDFGEFREISLFDTGGKLVATSRIGTSDMRMPNPGQLTPGRAYVATPRQDADALPTTTIAVPVTGGNDDPGWIVAEISLEELWRTVDVIKVGNGGYALLIDDQGKLVADGNPDAKSRIARGGQVEPREQELALKARQSPGYREPTYIGSPNGDLLAVAAAIDTPNWTVLVEQPVADAFETAKRLELQLVAAIGLATLGTIVVGWAWSRSFIRRIFALTKVTRDLATGNMDARVALSGRDEIQQLGEAFNTMADRLVELQEETRRQERQAMFGRVAAGLVHDINHPIQNIVNNAKLMLRMHDDEEFREDFRKIVEREGTTIKRVLDDLRNIAKPMPLERFPVDVNRTVAESVETMQQHAETAGVTLRAELTTDPAVIEGDIFALGRVYRNLILNAIQATAPGGLVVAATERHDDRVHVRVYDTGCGIPPERLGAVFEDFVTTKRRGLGLGLAISKKIVEQLDGRISVASEVGKGTTFVLDFPATRPRPMAIVS